MLVILTEALLAKPLLLQPRVIAQAFSRRLAVLLGAELSRLSPLLPHPHQNPLPVLSLLRQSTSGLPRSELLWLWLPLEALHLFSSNSSESFWVEDLGGELFLLDIHSVKMNIHKINCGLFIKCTDNFVKKIKCGRAGRTPENKLETMYPAPIGTCSYCCLRVRSCENRCCTYLAVNRPGWTACPSREVKLGKMHADDARKID